MHYYSELAEQSVHARLEIEKTNVRFVPLATQNKNDSLVDTYKVSENITRIDPNVYRIVNMPHMLKTLPTGSIFGYILYIDPASPDFRFVPITSSDPLSRDTTYPISRQLTQFKSQSEREAPENNAPIIQDIDDARTSDTRDSRARR